MLNKGFKLVALGFALVFVVGCATTTKPTAQWSLSPISIYQSGYKKGTEIISIQHATHRAVLSNSISGEIDVLDISNPQHLRRLSRFALGVGAGQELTSVAFHPKLDLFLAVIDCGLKLGRLEIRSASTGKLLEKITVGYGPDAVVLATDGSLALIANEGEDFGFNSNDKSYYSPEGSISLVQFDRSGQVVSNINLSLSDLTRLKSKDLGEGRYLARPIDWDGNGKISNELDFNGDGKITDAKTSLGYFQGREVLGIEAQGESEILMPIERLTPDILEPEYIAIAPDNLRAYVTLQEGNAIAVVELAQKKVVDYFNLGTAQHLSDLNNDDAVSFNDQLTALREPDGIAIVGQGRYLVTADEGDSVVLKNTNNLAAPIPVSGGRTVSVFAADTGAFIGDTGNQVDEVGDANGVYKDKFSAKKGMEPEMLSAFAIDGIPMVAVTLDEAGVVELISLANPAQPEVVALGKFADHKKNAPEGIAHFEVNGEHYLLTANEKKGTVECFKVVRGVSR